MINGTRFIVCAAIGLAAASATARQAADPSSLCPPCLHDQVLRGLPANVELIIAVNNAARQRASAPGRALGEALEASGAWTETFRAWSELSGALEWTPSRTFDELLGTRISLVARGLGNPEPEWAILAAVNGSTQKRLRDRLRAAPRGAVAGLSVLSIEDGSFQLLVAPCPEAGAKGEDGSIVLLAPRSSEALLDEVAPILAVRSLALPSVKEPACDVVVAVRPAGSTQRTLSITATSQPAGWDATVVCEPSLVFGAGRELGAVPLWRDSLFKELESGSMLAVMSAAGLDDVALLPAQLAPWKQLLTDLTGGKSGDGGLLRTGVFVRAVGPGPTRASEPFQTVATVHSPGTTIEATEGPRGRIAVSMLSESRDARATLVKGDAAMVRLARMIMTGQAEACGSAIRFEVPATGPRSLVVGESLIPSPELEPPLTRAFGSEPRLSWSIVDRRDGTGWWVGSLAPADTVPSREHRALAQTERGELRRRLSIGSVRPSALQRWIDAIEPGLLGPMVGAKHVESIRWDSWLRDDGRIGAIINIRMMTDSGR